MTTLVNRIKKRQADPASGRRFPAPATGSCRAHDVKVGAASPVTMVKSPPPSLLWLPRTALFLARRGAAPGAYPIRGEKGIVRSDNKSLTESRRPGDRKHELVWGNGQAQVSRGAEPL